MSAMQSRTLFLVLASRRSFESFAGTIPRAMKSRFRFQKSRNAARIRALLPECRLVISKNYCRPQSNRWIFEARRLGIPTLLLIDGPLEWANLYSNPSLAALGNGGATGLFEPIIHDAVATIGNGQLRWIGSRNHARGIELLSYANQRIQTKMNVRSANVEPEFDFLLTTARTAYVSDREKADLLVALRSCGAALERAGHRTLVRVFDDELRTTIQSIAPSCTFDAQDSFTEALGRTRCVIGTPSSVLLESMKHDKPTGLLMFRDSPLFYQSGWLLGCNEDWKSSFTSMLTRDPARMALQRQHLQEQLSDEDFFSHCERIANGEILEAPRPLDPTDLEFEHRLLHGILGWRARWIAALIRALAGQSTPDD